MFIPDPKSDFSIPDPRSRVNRISGSWVRIRIKEFKYFEPTKIVSKLSGKYDPECSSRMPDPDLDFYPSRIPDPGAKKALDPGFKADKH
jgi:hypothetical protein